MWDVCAGCMQRSNAGAETVQAVRDSHSAECMVYMLCGPIKSPTRGGGTVRHNVHDMPWNEMGLNFGPAMDSKKTEVGASQDPCRFHVHAASARHTCVSYSRPIVMIKPGRFVKLNLH